MPSAPQPPRRSWRDDAGGSREGTNKRKWQKDPGKASHGPRFSKRMKIALATLLLLAVTGGVIWLWLIIHRMDPPRLVLIDAGYETNLTVPPNVYGKNSVGDFAKWAGDYNKLHQGDREHTMEVQHEELTAESDPFDKTLKGCTSKSVVVFVTVHGGASASQGAYLIPDNATPKNNRALYTMDKALAALEQLPEKTKKLLILDTTQLIADWDLGMLHNDFVRALKNLLHTKNIHNLVVFCASDENQRSWVSEDYGRTIFAHFVMEGLRGAVKRDNDNGELLASELIAYVEKKVENWVRHNRGEQQKPLVIDPDNVAKSMVLPSGDPKNYTPIDPSKLTAFTPPPQLLAAWKQRDTLAASFPHPATYTPHLWREYHDSLLRYEQLLRAGDEANAATMAEQLDKLVSGIRHNQRLEYDALAGTLAMPTALGWSLPDQDEQKLRQGFNDLWARPTSTPEDFGRLLKDWQKNVNDPWLNQVGRVRVVTLLLAQARSSDANFQRACAILPHVDDPLLPRRPAEAHFALMMQTFMPKDTRPQMRASLSTRLHAEQAALGLPRLDGDGRLPEQFTPFSEQLLPWIRDDMARADHARRLREDLLFASVKEETRLGAELDDPDALYSKVQERAAVVHSVLQLRDRVLADFPYYSRWLVGQSLKALPENEEKRWLETWDNVHKLCRLLDASTHDLNALKAQANKIHFDDLAHRFSEEYMVKNTSATPKNWRRLNELLSVPLIPADYRRERLAELADVSRALNIGTGETAELTAVDSDNDRHPEAKAQLQGRFALHLLGNKHPVSEKAEQIIARPEGEWQNSLEKAGEQLGDAFNAQVQKLYEDTDKSRSAPLDEAAPLLRDAAVKVRLAPGAAVAAWAGLDPVGENRKVQMVELMKWQGERTFDDFWAAWTKDDQHNPYYRTAAGKYVAAALSLAGNDDSHLTKAQRAARTKGLAKLNADLAADDRLELRWRDGATYKSGPEPVLNITDEASVRRGFCLVCGPTTPDGFPVIWPDFDVKKLLKPANETDLNRRALDIPRKSDEGRLEFTLKPERPLTPTFLKEHTKYGLQGFYRGRRISQETAVTLHNLPEIVSFMPQMPPAGRIALVANKEDYDRFAAENSELVIVVDFSGSMGKVEGHPEITPRIDRVLNALETCLKNIPRGVKVTLLTFSHKGSDAQNEGIQVQWPKEPWDPATIDKKMAVLHHLTPWGNTPLVLATVEGLRQFTEGFDGAKTLLVLTDGGDNLYKTRDAATLKTDPNSMAKCLQKYFNKGDVALNVVGFELNQLTDADEKKGLKQYQDAIKTINGVFLSVDKSAELAGQLEQQLLQMRFHIDEKGGLLPTNKPKPPEGYPFSTTKGTGVKFWVGPLKPGLFNVVVQTNRLKRKALTQLVDVRAGESMVLKLARKPDGSGFYLTRETYADSVTIKDLSHEIPRREIPRNDVKDKTWILTVPQNQHIENNDTRDGLHMMVSLEEHDKKPIGRENSVVMTRPHFVWFRASVPGAPNKTVPGLRFYPLANYPAPCYRLAYRHWPEELAPQLDVWWNDRKLPEGDLVVRPNDQPLTQLVERSVEVQPLGQTKRTTVVIESIRQKRRPVVLHPGEKATKEVDCLVVRLRYPATEEPFFVQLPPGTNVGAEHRFYTEAGKYTGIFWNVSAATAAELKSLTIYSVAGVLKEAYHVGPLDLKAPNRYPPPPQPEDALR